MASLLPLLLLVLLPPSSGSPSPTSLPSTLLSLKSTFSSTVGSPLDGWDPSLPLCAWPRLACDPSNTTLFSLDLSSLNLTGPLPLSLPLLLPSLLHLNLSNNHLHGSPSTWRFPVTHPLLTLDLYNNDLSGPVPGHLPPSLLHLDLGGNYLSGPITASIPLLLPNLLYLSLAGNDLSGPIPPHLGNLTSLRQLYLGYFNQFQGGVPTALGNLVHLTHLDLSSCGLSGPVPPQLGNLQNLDTLFLQTNKLTGPVPVELGNLTRISALDLSNNALSGGIPAELGQLRSLRLLYLFINRFRGELPGFLSELPELQLLKLWQNNFTGSIPSRLGSNGKLREVDLSSNKLTGVIPETICTGRRLEILILQYNFLFGPLPNELGRCRGLARVRLAQNYLSGAIPRGFLYLPELQLVELQNNYFTGRLSEESPLVGSRPLRLTQINLSNNRLFGSIPTSFGRFGDIQILELGGNQFDGEIPRELGQLKQTLRIDLSKNNLSGSIPVELSGCSLLSYLDLSENNLSGSLPPQISQIRVLNYLNVSWNRLTGSVPKELGAMKSLTSVDFSHNDFSGRVPDNGQFAYFNSSSFLFNPRLCGSTLTACNATFSSMSPVEMDGQGRVKSGLMPGRFKLLLALVLLACSLVFAATVLAKTRSMMFRRGPTRWKLTAFQKLQFTVQDIVECMKETNVIGRGGAGVVYRGSTPTGEAIAVKRLLGMNRGNGSSHDNGFNAEIQTLGRIRHRNIVRLLAFCSNKEINLLVYEYMPNGSLGEVLHGKRGGYLGWDVRLKIAVEAARGLSYLHHDCCPPILHRDVKSNNILLNGDFEAHVADFGLAKFLRDTGMSECMSAIAGSYGYIAPEYAYTLKVDEKSDVYSFGVVLLELITGRKPVGDFGEEGLDIVQWAKMNTNWSKEGVVNILDKRLSEVPMDEAMQVFFVGMLCVQEQSIERPTMREVVQMLGQAKQPNGML